MKKIETIYSAKAVGHYSPAIRSGNLLFISGQLSMDQDKGCLPEGGIEAEAVQALKNLDIVLEAAGLSKESVVHCRIYITNLADFQKINSIYAEYFGEHKPARVVVPVPALFGNCAIEIEAVAEFSE